MNELRVGIVGLGLGAVHAHAYEQSEKVKTIALCDPNENRLGIVKNSLHKVKNTYLDLEHMLAYEELDAVSIVSPDPYHRVQAEAAFAAGCHVLLTKPLASNLEDARAIIRQSEKAGRKLMVAQEQRFHTREQRIKEILESGHLGELIHMRVDSFHDKTDQFRQSPWYASAAAGRTAMVGTGIHEVDLIRYLSAKRVNRVFAFGNSLGALEFPGNKTVAALFELEGRSTAQVTVTYVARSDVRQDSFMLLGTQGMVSGSSVFLDKSDVPERLPEDDKPIVTGTRACVMRFITAITEDAAIPVTGRDAFASLAACAAADESCITGDACVPASELFS